MERLREALNILRTDTEKASTRRKEADARSKVLQTRLQEREEVLSSLEARYLLVRRLIELAGEWDMVQHKLRDNNERIHIANSKANGLEVTLQASQTKADTFEAEYMDICAKHRELQAQLDELLQ